MSRDQALQYVGLIPLAVVGLIAVAIWNLPGAKAQRNREMAADPLVKELSELKLPPLTTLRGDCTYSAKGNGTRLYECAYNSELAFQSLLAHYSAELNGNGWKPAAAPSAFAYWCRNGHRATLEYSGAASSTHWTYVFAISKGVPPYACEP
jgi:hypothetical protein